MISLSTDDGSSVLLDFTLDEKIESCATFALPTSTQDFLVTCALGADDVQTLSIAPAEAAPGGDAPDMHVAHQGARSAALQSANEVTAAVAVGYNKIVTGSCKRSAPKIAHI